MARSPTGAYSAGYFDACARAGMQARVVALSPAGGWYQCAMSFLRDVRHSGDEAAAVGLKSEAVRVEHTHQSWQTTKYSTSARGPGPTEPSAVVTDKRAGGRGRR